MPPSVRRSLRSSSFSVDAGLARQDFTRVVLPKAELEVIESRAGSDLSASADESPGSADYGRLVLQRVLTPGDRDLWQWWCDARNGQDADRNVAVRLQNSAREPLVRWVFTRAFPATYEVSVLDASSSEVVTETVALAFDTMELETT